MLLTTLALIASLFGDFANPPVATRPWCYWYWVNGNVDEETITADLEAMKRVGFGGVLLLDPRGCLKYKAEPSNEADGSTTHRLFAEGYSQSDPLESCGLFGPMALR